MTLKANALSAFADQCAPLLGKDTEVVFVQNGIPWWYDARLTRLDPDGRLARAVPAANIAGGVAYSANEIVEPGVIENHVPGNNMIVDRPRRTASRRRSSRTCARRWRRRTSRRPPLADIRQSIWQKAAQMLGNSSFAR